jgi:hypothetical protein
MSSEQDVSKLEKGSPSINADSVKEGHASRYTPWLRRLATHGVELSGIVPVPLEERTDKKATNLLSLWFTANLSLLP